MKLKYLKFLFFTFALVGSLLVFTAVSAQQQTVPQAKGFNCNDFFAKFQLNAGGKQIDVIEGLPRFCSFEQIALTAINWGLMAIGTVTVIFLILGGYWFLTSSGNEEQAEKGRKVLTNSVIGLVVVIMASAIVRIIISALNTDPPARSTVTSTDVTQVSQQQPAPAAQENTSSGGGSLFDNPDGINYVATSGNVDVLLEKNDIRCYIYATNTKAQLQLQSLCKTNTEVTCTMVVRNGATYTKSAKLSDLNKIPSADIKITQTPSIGDSVTVTACGQTMLKKDINEANFPVQIR